MATTITDLFNQKPFQAMELTTTLEEVAPKPMLLGSVIPNLFTTINSWTGNIAVFRRERTQRLVPISPYGAPPVEYEETGGEMRYYSTHRMAKGSTVYAREVQGILQMPLFNAVTTMQAEVVKRSARIRDDIELTEEHMRFGMIQGKVLDADGVTVIDDWYANWGITAPVAWNMALDVDTTPIRLICDNIVTAIRTACKADWVEGQSQVHALCGDEFYVKLVTHPSIERLYMGYAAAMELAGKIPTSFPFGGIMWHRYVSTPGTPFSIPSDEARIFPTNAGDIFQRVYGPCEFDPFINQPGRGVYALTILDRDRGAWARTELYNYPLYVCNNPGALQTAVME